MKAVIQNILDSRETPISEDCIAVYGDKNSRLRIMVRKINDEEVIEINGDDAIQVLPRAANSIYIRVGD